MFHSDDCEFAEGCKCADSKIYLKPGIKNYFKVLVINGHNVFLQTNSILGNLEYISSVVPLEVKHRNLEHQ